MIPYVKTELQYVSKRIDSFITGVHSIDHSYKHIHQLVKPLSKIRELLNQTILLTTESNASLITCYHIKSDLSPTLVQLQKKTLSTKCVKECNKLGINLNELLEEIEEVTKEVGIFLNSHIKRKKEYV